MAVIKKPVPKGDVHKKIKRNELHDRLVQLADRWLKRKGCLVRIHDGMKSATLSGEQPDNIGWRDGLSLMIECKTSRGDFLADQKKRFRTSTQGVGDWRFYLCPKNIIQPEELPEGWGLLWVEGEKVIEVKGVPANTQWWSKRPFEGNKHDETIILASALRRLEKLGLMEKIYEKK